MFVFLYRDRFVDIKNFPMSGPKSGAHNKDQGNPTTSNMSTNHSNIRIFSQNYLKEFFLPNN